jgi:hypothetical protein
VTSRRRDDNDDDDSDDDYDQTRGPGIRGLGPAAFHESDLISPPSATVAGSHIIFGARGQDQKVHLLRYNANNNKFSRWEVLDGTAYSGVAVASCSDHVVHVLFKSAEGCLVHAVCEGSFWSPWEPVPGDCASTPTCCSVAEDTLEVFAANSANKLLWRRQNVGRWTDWRELPVSATSPPCAVATIAGLEVFCKSPAGTLLWLRSSPSGWGEWVDLGGELSLPPRACLGINKTKVYVFVVGLDTVCHFIERDLHSETWSPWRCLGGRHGSAVACAAVSGTALEVIFLLSATLKGEPQICRCVEDYWGAWKLVPSFVMF